MLMWLIISGLRAVRYTTCCWKLMDFMLSGVRCQCLSVIGSAILAIMKLEGINVTISWSLVHLSQRLDPQTLDLSGMGPGIDVCEQRACCPMSSMMPTLLESMGLSP